MYRGRTRAILGSGAEGDCRTPATTILLPEVDSMRFLHGRAIACRYGRRISALLLAVILGGLLLATSAMAVDFNPALMMSDDTMRAYDTMSAADIQAFLVTKNSLLKDMSFRRHGNGPTAPASVIIYEAARAYKINPRVLLALLQKEQSLITRTTVDQRTLDRAVGAGCPNKYTNRYPGFGNQMWNGARMLDSYGEGKGGSTIALYNSKRTVTDIYQKPNVRFHPLNIATYKLYVYNPSIGAPKPYGDLSVYSDAKLGGNASMWRIYWRFFGDPLGQPAVRPIYSFYHKRSGGYLYTSSPAEKYRLLTRSAKTFKYKGTLASVNTSGTTNVAPVYRFYDKRSKVYTYATSEATKTKLRTGGNARRYSYQGVALMASMETSGTPVYRFANRKSGATVYVASEAQKLTYLKAKNAKLYRYKGVAFYLAP